MSRPKRSIEEAAVRLDKAFGGKIIPVEPYPGSTKHWRIHCVDCGRESSRRVSELLRLGCAKCAVVKRNKARSTPHEIAIAKLEQIHAGAIVAIGTYVNRITPWKVRCIPCGHEWSPKANNLLDQKSGCPVCGYKKASAKRILPEKIALARIQDIHQGRIIPIGRYCSVSDRLQVRCECGYAWSPDVQSLHSGRGCPKCAVRGFNFSRPGLLYYVRVSNPFGEPVYKIGITNRTVRERLYRDIGKIAIIETWCFQNGAEAFEMEQDILNDYDADRYTGPDILESGNDELFIVDVLGLDKGAGQLELVA